MQKSGLYSRFIGIIDSLFKNIFHIDNFLLMELVYSTVGNNVFMCMYMRVHELLYLLKER